MRLPTGEVELLTAPAMKEAFRCGLIDLRTPVRPFDGHAWITLEEAAGFDERMSDHFPSLTPIAIDNPAPDLDDGAPWRVRRYVDEGSLRPGKTRVAGAILLTIGAFAAIAALVRPHVGSGVLEDRLAQARAASDEANAAAAMLPPPAVEAPRPPPAPERLTEHQKRRLREMDAERAYKAAIKKQKRRAKPQSSILEPPPDWRGAPRAKEPFTEGGNRFDPLNGAL